MVPLLAFSGDDLESLKNTARPWIKRSYSIDGRYNLVEGDGKVEIGYDLLCKLRFLKATFQGHLRCRASIDTCVRQLRM